MLTTLDLKVLWRNVCSKRGTRPPAAEGLDVFLDDIQYDDRRRLQEALIELQKGSDSPEHFGLLRWAWACTQASVLSKAKEAGLECSSSGLFSGALMLLDSGVDPVSVLTNHADHAANIATIKVLCTLEIPVPEPLLNSIPRELPQAVRPLAQDVGEASLTRPPIQAEEDGHRLTLRLFGSTAAHTLEISDHRRASNFLGVRVVVIESAQATPQGGFDWDKKLSIQLTPEEMPEVIAALLGIVKEATFSNHGTDRNKTVTFRNQEGGLQLVTSRRSTTYPVPVKTPVIYYLLDLFCRAMCEGRPNRSTSDVITMVRGIYS